MKVTVKKKDESKLLPIETEFIKLDAALKYAALVATGGEAQGGHRGRNGHRQRRTVHHAGQEAPPRRQLLLQRREL